MMMTPDTIEARIAAYQRKRDEFAARNRALIQQQTRLHQAGEHKRADALTVSVRSNERQIANCAARIAELARGEQAPAAPIHSLRPAGQLGLFDARITEVSR